MTQTARERFDRLTGARRPELVTGAADIRRALLEQLTEQTGIRWPSPKYRENPVAFVREVLGVEPWYMQCQILDAMVEHPRGAVKSGHKIGKSDTIAMAASWVYSSFEDAMALMTSTTARQVDSILWLAFRKMLARSGKCVACKIADPDDRFIARPCEHSAIIPEKPAGLARTGMHSADFRSVAGFTAREAEAVQGSSGKNLWYFPDEASGIPSIIFEAMEGNRAGGAKLWMFGNPTKNEGEFYDAFNSKAKHYKTFTVSSEQTPNVIEGREVIPGLATKEWIEEKREEWGEDSPLFKVRVKGEFAEKEDGKIFSVHTITQAELRWHELNREEGETVHAARARIQAMGRLFLAIDLAGATGMGDEEMFVKRRGSFMYDLERKPGLTNESRLVEILATLERDRLPREVPVVVFDREGEIGARFNAFVRAFLEQNPGAFEIVAVRASDAPVRRPLIYGRMRDELTGNFEEWLRAGGGIPEDVKLAAEMHAMEWDHGNLGKLKVTPKKDVKKKLGRSPDRYDACVLSAWEPLYLRDGAESAPASVREKAAQIAHAAAHGQTGHYAPAVFDPYAGGDAFRRR